MDYAAVYMIANLVNGRRYIGSASEVHKRFRTHKSELNRNKHHNTSLQDDFNKYGIVNFSFVVLEQVADKDNLKEREQVYIDKYDFDSLYNHHKDAHGPSGYTVPEDKRNVDNRGENNPMFGKHQSQELKNRYSKERKGDKNPNAKLSDEDVLKIKELLSEGKLTQGEIGKLFNVHRSHISKIKTGGRR